METPERAPAQGPAEQPTGQRKETPAENATDAATDTATTTATSAPTDDAPDEPAPEPASEPAPERAAELRRLDADPFTGEERFRAVFDESGIGIRLGDLEGRTVMVNQAFAQMIGHSRPAAAALHDADLLHPDQEGAEEAAARHRDLLAGRVDRVKLRRRFRHSSGRLLWTSMTMSLIRDATGQPVYTLSLVEDISEQHELQERLRHQAQHDPLTGLPNRALFFERLEAATSGQDARVGVCYLDLDGFKAVNDTLGHHMGDDLLAHVADRLADRIGAADRLIARMGGDEFVVLVERSTGLAQVTAIAEEVLRALDAPFEIGGQRVSVSASIGVVEQAAAQTTPAELMTAADASLYWAKHEGKGRWRCWEPDRAAREVTRQRLATTMRPAIEQGEFHLEYQPLVDLRDGALRGVEALVRWNHPRLGRIAPSVFIGLAEETGAIVPLGRWILTEACSRAAEWAAAIGRECPFLSVNLTVRQMWESDVVRDVLRALEVSGLPPALLQLELTESDLLGDAGRPVEALNELAHAGVRIAIDDFGTGYSNLAYLSMLPVHALKLDGMFVQGFGTTDRSGSRNDTIVTALVRLAHSLGITVTAEGVEREEQVSGLRAADCDLAQGWYFARPVSAEDLTAMLLRGTPPPGAGPAVRDR
ncbi:putative bifunctional diguanylate cyclase/phosphodiesterase [Allostreptomyces psammosilenae]|uniref:Diguanylate cyclase (GGDEF)-like protein/PAS domain S-box-containing protein n=1 Tax=Allostreptomyces psammosilenae TaxID=1892865 RepID=A0A853A450_9ACTN|nr:EAL domain-containing protein [Allostreptomyces psammosilenae]NYI08240.1 diguanylate cyclase (GGDEF)-like protein/PAS domain S-box-containing protein [Allostreptomyces psammosilenae]